MAEHFGDPDTTVIDGELYVAPDSLSSIKELRAPDMLICLRCRPRGLRPAQRLCHRRAGPPDFVLEVASRFTGHIDVQDKPADYAALGILQVLALRRDRREPRRAPGRRLLQADPITELPDGSLEGYSEVLGLNLRWEQG